MFYLSITSNIWVYCDSDKYALKLPDVGDGCPIINYKVMGQDEKLRRLKRHASVLSGIPTSVEHHLRR